MLRACWYACGMGLVFIMMIIRVYDKWRRCRRGHAIDAARTSTGIVSDAMIQCASWMRIESTRLLLIPYMGCVN